jgi:hypothetical protein
LNWEQTEKLVTMVLEEKNPLKLSKELSVRKEIGNNEKKMPAEK